MQSAPVASVPAYGALFYVAAVNIVIWAGLFTYLFYLDRKVRSALRHRTPEDKPGRKPIGSVPCSSSVSSCWG